MSRRISCPHCGKQLSVRPELIGKKVECPRCAKRFRHEHTSGEEPTSVVEVAPPNPNLFPPDTPPSQQTPAHPSTDRPTRAAHPHGSTSEKEPTSKPGRRGPAAGNHHAPPGGGAQNSLPQPAPPTADQHEAGQTARFIERDANATQVQLGEDGQLPDLALATREKRDDSLNEPKSSNPWLLITVLCASVVMSVLILLIDEPGPAGNRSKADAREQVERIFASWDRTDESAMEVRDALAGALQAHNRGDNEEEREYYRQVLDLLNREDAPKYGGFSGNDKKLKQLINELLR